MSSGGYGRAMRRRCVLPMLLLCGGMAFAEPPLLRYGDGRLTARIDQVPLAEVLERLAAETGARIGGDVGEARDVTAHFDALPLDRALDRLLGPQSYTLRYGPGGRLVSIDLGGLPAAPPARPAGEPPELPDLQRYRVRLTPALQKALLREYAPLAAVLRALGTNLAPKLRSEGVRFVVSTIEADATLHAAIVGMNDDDFLAMLQGYVSRRTADVLGEMMGIARSFALRAKAARSLQALRTAPPAG